MPAASPNVPSRAEISLSPPRSLSNALYPLQEDHILDLFKNSKRGTNLLTDVDSIAKEHDIHPILVTQHHAHLKELAEVYSSAKDHSTAHRTGLHGLLDELNTGIILLAQDFEVLHPKLHNFINHYDSKQAVDGILDTLSISLSNLILKTGHILDTIGETDKSVNYGQKHVSRVHKQVKGLLKNTDFEDDLDNIGDSVSPTATTILSLQGGFARLLVNVSVVKSKVESGVTDPKSIYADNVSEDVVNAWAIVKGKAQEFRSIIEK